MHLTSAWKQTSLQGHELVTWHRQTQTRKTDEDLAGNIQRRPSRYGAYLDGCKEICQRQTEMEKARRPMFRQELEDLRSKVRIMHQNLLLVSNYYFPQIHPQSQADTQTKKPAKNSSSQILKS